MDSLLEDLSVESKRRSRSRPRIKSKSCNSKELSGDGLGECLVFSAMNWSIMLGVTSRPGLFARRVLSISVSSVERRGPFERSLKARKTSTRASAGMVGSPDSFVSESG